MANSEVIFPNICFSLCIILILMIMTPIVFIPASEYRNYKQHKCHINRVEYPTSLPTVNNTVGWERCDCGKRCVTWSPCINIFTNVSNDVFVRPKFYEIDEKCTFHDMQCPNGEDVTVIIQELESAAQKYNEYFNKTIDCYYDSDINYIFLEKKWNWGLTIAFTVLVGLMILLLIFLNIHFCYFNYKLKKIYKKNKGDEFYNI